MERKYKTTTLEAIQERIAKGMNFREIADELGVCLSQLRSAASLLGIASAYKRGRSGKAPEYFSLLNRGLTLKEIGMRYGITGHGVRYALKSNGFPTTLRGAVKANQGIDIDAVHKIAA